MTLCSSYRRRELKASTKVLTGRRNKRRIPSWQVVHWNVAVGCRSGIGGRSGLTDVTFITALTVVVNLGADGLCPPDGDD
jgi:hypothetical protein